MSTWSLMSKAMERLPYCRSRFPSLSTWAMMLLGFAGFGFAGYRRARATHTFA